MLLLVCEGQQGVWAHETSVLHSWSVPGGNYWKVDFLKAKQKNILEKNLRKYVGKNNHKWNG